jgi:ArsR family transcriptional regulator
VSGVIKNLQCFTFRFFRFLPLFPLPRSFRFSASVPSTIFVYAHMRPTTATDLLLTVAEPTRLRILNCLAAAPLFVSDLQAVLDLPQPTVSRHLQVLRRAQLVRDTPIAQYVLYHLQRNGTGHRRMLSAILDAVIRDDDDMRDERNRAAVRSRSHTRLRVQEPQPSRARSSS